MKRIGLTALSLVWALLVVGQGSQQQQYSIPKIEDIVKIPHSPEAQAFTKYGNTSVNLYTGTPDITIPIANLKGRELEIPISLSYDASGVKVEQIASWVGINWNLNVGGVVTRNVVGYPDDYISALPYYFPHYALQVKADVNFAKSFMPEGNHAAGELARYYDIMRHVVSSERYFWLDVEPDTYSFNVLGLSGTLMINYDNNTAYCLDHPEIKAIPIFNEFNAPVSMFVSELQQQQIVQQPIKNLVGWEIYDANGNHYYFNSVEVTTVSGDNNTIDFSRKYNSAFHLTKIVSTTKKDEILFNYSAIKDLDNYQLAGRGDARHDYTATAFGIGNDATIPARPQFYKIGQSQMTDIIINGKTVANFIPEPLYRKDLQGRKALDKIVFVDLNGNQTSSFDFIQSYVGDPGQTDEKNFRLFLDRVDSYGTSNSTPPQSYTFLYNSPGASPPRDSFSMDFWGYFNGAPNSTLVPYDYDLDRYDQVVTGFLGADRRPNLSNTLIGSLRKIIYPTKGSTEFTYKLNRAAEETYTRKDDFIYGSATLIGAIDNTNMCEPDRVRPKKLDGQFTITEGGTFRLSISTTGYTGNPVNQIRFLGIYYAGALTDQTTIQRSGCELYNDIAIPTLYRYNFSDQTSNFSTDFNVVLQPGKYGYALLNSDPSTSVSFELVGGKVTSYKDAGGLRITSIIDKDENDQIASKSYYYYNDLSILSPAAINEGVFSADNYLTSGTLQQTLQFHDGVAQEYYLDLEDGTIPQLVSTQYHRRFSENRVKANMIISYPIVSEVKFSGTEFLGVTVMEFINSVENYVFGYKRNALLNGKLKEKRVYDNALTLLHSERNYFSQRSNGPGEVGFIFRSVKEFRKDLRIKAPIATPSIEFTDLQDPTWWLSTTGNVNVPPSWFESHCPVRETNLYNTIRCYTFGADYVRDSYSYGKYWVTLDSTITKDYVNTQNLQAISKYFYENTSHYQVTRTERTDSKNVTRKALITYSPEMKVLFPTSSIWSYLVEQNRIAEPVKIVATVGSNTPDFVQNTIYKNLAPDYKQIVPDKVQFSSGNGPLEDRIRYHQYDAIGNPIEISREGDTRVSFIWGYNSQMPIAEVKNASANEIFHTSFEAGEEGGNSTDYDSRTGIKSKTGDYTKTLNGLTPNKAYVLTYWQKVSNVWTLQTLNIAPSTSTSYTIRLTGQVDEVRFAPADAMMTTYTHKLGSGLSSTTDPNNQTTYFEYDTFNRLHLVRDQDQKILKQHKYNYYQPAN